MSATQLNGMMLSCVFMERYTVILHVWGCVLRFVQGSRGRVSGVEYDSTTASPRTGMRLQVRQKGDAQVSAGPR